MSLLLRLRSRRSTLSRVLENAGAAIWIGGQLFGALALPAAASAMPRRKDRRRVIIAGWDAWTPIALTAIGAAGIGALLELRDARKRPARQRALVRLVAATAGIASTTLASALGTALKRDRHEAAYPVIRSDSGLPAVMLPPRPALKTGMIPVNILHLVAAAGLLATA